MRQPETETSAAFRPAEASLRDKLVYGAGETAISVKNSSLNQYLLFFYTELMQVEAALVGTALFLGKLWDAVTDPLVGYVSDSTRSRWGRRRPYVVASVIPMGLCYYLLYAPPQLSATGMFWYLLVMNILLFTFFTVYTVPYLAWGAEISEDYHDRTKVAQIRALFGVAGGALGVTLQYGGDREGFAQMAMVLASLMIAAGLISGIGSPNRDCRVVPSASFDRFTNGLRITFRNRLFRVLFATFCLMTMAAALGQSVQLHVVKYWLGLHDFFPLIALTFALSFAGSFPFWLGVSRRGGKHRALLTALALACITPFGWLLVQPGQLWQMLLFVLAGGAVSGSIPLAMSQAMDVIDIDELQTGEQRAGAYFGIWALGLKTTSAFGLLLGGVCLRVVGYTPNQAQEPETLWWLLVLVGPLQAFVHLLGFIVLRRIRLEPEDVLRVQQELRARRAVP